jgi:hypothetical protein
VTFEVACDLRGPDACHCTSCRKHSGHVFASTDVPRSAVTIHGGDNLTWYQSSEKARRGFCSTCGSSLFWDPLLRDWIGIAMGAFDGPTQSRLHVHIFVGDKGDYYDIADGVPQFEQVPPAPS